MPKSRPASSAPTPETERLRLDKWLWSARFFKTRSIAADAVESGKVLVNEARVKPAKAVAVGDCLDIRLGPYHFIVEVLGISNRRGPAPEAQKLYQETEHSRAQRAALAAQMKALAQSERSQERPTKKDRREIDRFRSGAW